MDQTVRTSELAAYHKALASTSRLKILSLLAESSLCVNAIAGSLGISQPAVSQHLEILKEARLVTSERAGTKVHYRLNRDQLQAVGVLTASLLAPSKEHVSRSSTRARPPRKLTS